MLAVTFRVADGAYAIPCEQIVAVIPRVQLRSVAKGAAWLKGAFAYRSELTPVIDLCQLIGGYACPERLSSRIALVRCKSEAGCRTLGLLAEHMTEARRVAGQAVATPPVTPLPYFGQLLLEAGEPLQLLDVDALLPSSGLLLPQAEALSKVMASEKDREPPQP
jgi:chemotaxis signal transduction protein